MSNPDGHPRRWLLRLSLLAVVLTGILGATLLLLLTDDEQRQWHATIGASAAVLTLLRLVIIAGLYLAWPSVLRSLQHRQWIRPVRAQRLLAARGRLAIWCIAIELVIGLDSLNRVVHLVAGSVA